MLVQGLVENEANNYMLLHALFKMLKLVQDWKIQIFHFQVFVPLKEHFCMKRPNTDVQFNLLVVFGHQG
jgi:hypothetical protein